MALGPLRPPPPGALAPNRAAIHGCQTVADNLQLLQRRHVDYGPIGRLSISVTAKLMKIKIVNRSYFDSPSASRT